MVDNNHSGFVLQDFSISDLVSDEKLSYIDEQFLEFLKGYSVEKYHLIKSWRQNGFENKHQYSQAIVDIAPILEDFIVDIFAISSEYHELQSLIMQDKPLWQFYHYFIKRCARRQLNTPPSLLQWQSLSEWLLKQVNCSTFSLECERAVAEYALAFQATPDSVEHHNIVQWCVGALILPEAQPIIAHWLSLQLPQKMNFQQLVETTDVVKDDMVVLSGPDDSLRPRDGFDLTDKRMPVTAISKQADYCVYCHEKQDDFCSTGFPIKKNTDQGVRHNSLNVPLRGCPLDEKISEMNMLRDMGHVIAALAAVTIDNPLCALTGHRICNDCMLSCIYQKQQPVNIPEIETSVLTDILNLPYGVEIYLLLIRWNPLRIKQWLPKPFIGKSVAIMGIGPAGIAMSHHLLMEGCAVVAMDGLKIEPLDSEVLRTPIKSYKEIYQELTERTIYGFGGVSEYGITSRWDKNFLLLIYISLMRRDYFRLIGQVRFGGNFIVSDAVRLGFQHLCIAVGAGLPRELNIVNSLAPGMRQANDFLMYLQLSGAYRDNALVNMDIRMPAVVIGGGLTAIDTATEVQAYYIKQVEQLLNRYEVLIAYFGEERLQKLCGYAIWQVWQEYCLHGSMVRKERQLAQQQHRNPNFIHLLRQWGGVTIIYRKNIQDSPAYKRNYEEIKHAMNEGMLYAECWQPTRVVIDETGHCCALICNKTECISDVWMELDQQYEFSARSIFIATGAKPNIAYAYEHRADLRRNKQSYALYRLDKQNLQETTEVEPNKAAAIFTSYEKDNQHVSVIGDTNPAYQGSVVNALASAAHHYQDILDDLSHISSVYTTENMKLHLDELSLSYQATITQLDVLADDLIELTVLAPQVYDHLQAGQFCRVQAFDKNIQSIDNTFLSGNALALLASKVPDKPGYIQFVVKSAGVNTRLLKLWRDGQQLALMGPTGAHFKPRMNNSRLLVIGGVNAYQLLRSISPEWIVAATAIDYIALFDKPQLWHHKITELPLQNTMYIFKSQGNEDFTGVNVFYGDWFEQWQKDAKQGIDSLVSSATDILVVMEPCDLKKFRLYYNTVKDRLKDNHKIHAAVYNTMQCMLKGVCAQCLQWQIDPQTQQRSKAVYACSWQHQPFDMIDLDNFGERLNQNSVQQRISQLWLDYLSDKYNI